MRQGGKGECGSSTALLSLALFAVPIIILRLNSYREKQNRRGSYHESLDVIVRKHPETPLRPPFPKVVQVMLSKCRLAYLSTVDAGNASSHLSLMRFTYVKEEEVIIMSTNRNTKKFDMLRRQGGVALLVHDFAQHGDGTEGDYSITLNGQCSILEGEDAERYRASHLKHNPDYPQFIVGEDIAILCVEVSSARICNINDNVLKWDVNDGASGLLPS